MIRFQFEPRGLHVLDFAKAHRVAREHGARRISEAFPLMPRETGKPWVGTNQPRTVAFSVRGESDARAIEAAYGDELVFVRRR